MSRRNVNAGDGLVITDAPAFTNLSAFTWAAWARIESGGILSTIGTIASRGPTGTTTYKRFRPTTDLRLLATVTRAGGTALAQTVPNTIAQSAWQHVAMSYEEADGIRLFSNGIECSYSSRVPSSGATTADSGTDLFLMNAMDGLKTLDGCLAEFGVWNRVLATNELAVLALSRYTPALVKAGLVGAWRLLGGVSPEPDAVGGNHASVVGGAASDHPLGMIVALPERQVMTGMCIGTLRRTG